ncbi:MAG: PilZ domain-containing protein [Candidatus Omnitrophica bacterium]|nr:PilZ domain-containing protein [Candidatus Omnitrophota bacterium]MBI3083342.1 PilZ domain-containing protein [Candidatus Omnitrophota bacterium]
MSPLERRSAQRLRAYQPVRLRKLHSPQVIETLTKDLSAGGVRCLSTSVFPVSTQVNVDLVLSSGEEPFSAMGRAVWFQIIPHSDQFDIGISFVEVPPQHKRRLSVYLDHLSAKSLPVPA